MANANPGKLVRVHASRLRAPSQKDFRRLERAGLGRVNTSDIPEQEFVSRSPGPIWRAITDELRRRGLTGHRLWKMAQPFCPRLPESAVYEFMGKKRSVRVEYADAMLQALGLRLTPSRRKKAG